MANVKQPRVRVDRDAFLWAIRSHGYTVNSIAKAIGRSSKTIQRGLSEGEMQPWVVMTIAGILGIEPETLIKKGETQ